MLVAIAVSAVFSACDSKKEIKKIGDYELTEANGLFGLKGADGRVILPTEFAKIEEHFGAVIADDKDEKSTIVVNGTVIAENLDVSSFEPIDGTDYIYIKTAPNSEEGQTTRLWKSGTSDIMGPFADIVLIDDILFLNSEGYWGAATLSHQGLAPRQFEMLYVVKNGNKLAVLVKSKKGWEMYSGNGGVSNGVRYDIAPKKLEKQIQALKLGDKEIAVANVDWKL